MIKKFDAINKKCVLRAGPKVTLGTMLNTGFFRKPPVGENAFVRIMFFIVTHSLIYPHAFFIRQRVLVSLSFVSCFHRFLCLLFQELTLMDDTVLEEHFEDPRLVHMKILGDGGNYEFLSFRETEI